MKKYISQTITSPVTICGEEWQGAELMRIDSVWEDKFPSPYETTAKILHTDEGVYVKLSTNEWPLRITAMTHNDSICVDSCMEFFFTPNTVDADYINFEMNPVGATLTCIGAGRHNRQRIDIHGEGVRVCTLVRPEEGWDAMIFVSFDFMRKHFSTVEGRFRANLYKCGDKTVIQHYSTWNKVDTPAPDYHQPAFFGEVILKDADI